MNVKMQHGHQDDHDRIDQRAFDLAFERQRTFLELGQALENGFQGTARLAGLDHVDVQAVEGLGAFGHGLREGGAGFDVVAGVHQAVFQPARLLLVLEDFEAAQDRQAGILQDGKLPGEGGQLLGLDAADGERPLAAVARPFWPPPSSTFLTEIFVMKYPIFWIVTCASSSLAASSTSRISCPVRSRASN